MKLIILMLGLLSQPSFAEFGNWFPVGKTEAITIYRDKTQCEEIEGQECFTLNTNEKDADGNLIHKTPHEYEVRETQVLDFSKPNFGEVYSKTACDTYDHCTKKIYEGFSCESGDQLKIEENSFFPGYKMYCLQHLGYQAETVKVMVKINQGAQE